MVFLRSLAFLNITLTNSKIQMLLIVMLKIFLIDEHTLNLTFWTQYLNDSLGRQTTERK